MNEKYRHRAATQEPEGSRIALADLLARPIPSPEVLQRHLEMVGKINGQTSERKNAIHLLAKRGRLRPAPELHWLIDRTLADYHRRFGFSLIEFLRAMQDEGRKKILLELGPGSALSQHQRVGWSPDLAEGYIDIAIADTVYFALDHVLKNIIDFSIIEQKTTQPLTPNDRADFLMALHHTAMIADGQTERDVFEYDRDFYTTVSTDLNALRDALPHIQTKLQHASVFPTKDSVSLADGQVTFPKKLYRSKLSPATQAALHYAEQHLVDAIKPEARTADLYTYANVYPESTIVGDFDQIAHLPEESIDVGLTVRSLVYKRGAEYTKTIVQMERVLRKDGVLIDDSIREINGSYYRLAEWQNIRTKIRAETTVGVITGPGFTGEDLRADHVPLGIVMARTNQYQAFFEHRLSPGFSFHSLDDLCSDRAYLESLDTTGRVAESCNKPMAFSA